MLVKNGGCMKKFLVSAVIIASSSIHGANVMFDGRLNILELDAKKALQGFNDLSKNMSIASISESIVSRDALMLKDALSDVINLNKMVNSQVNVAIQFWNVYLDSVKIPSLETYLLGQVMNSLIGTIRALSLRSSLDQAMILSFIKKYFSEEQQPQFMRPEMATTIDVRESCIEDRWKCMKIQ
jgi:hypothetical protein